MNRLDDPAGSGLVGCIREIHAAIEGSAYLSRADCVDWLLDLLNTAVRVSVKETIRQQLLVFSSGNLAAAGMFVAALDEIEMAAKVDEAFDRLEIDDSAASVDGAFDRLEIDDSAASVDGALDRLEIDE